jgi:hypothetical protein
MADAANSCPKCKSLMEESYVFDRGHLSTANPLTWIAGRWMPLRLKERKFFDPPRDKKYRSISSHSRTKCGCLEVYAK